MDQPTLLLTATIDPQGMSKLVVCDVSTRLAQYLQAFEYWLERPDADIDSIVLVESSGYDLSAFQQIIDSENPHGKKVELISLTTNDFPRELGKGYGEFRMVDEAVKLSKLIAARDAFIKLTGRLIVRNLPAVVRRLPKRYDMVCDASLVPTIQSGGLIDSRLVFFSKAFYTTHAMGLYRRMNDSQGVFAEYAFFQLLQTSTCADLVTQLPVQPDWRGVSGSMGMDYGSLKQRLKRPGRILRRYWRRFRGHPSLASIRAAAAHSQDDRPGIDGQD